ncbi:MAG TPA: NAD/NADP octopine/nopaline dehydrogenase family protein [Caldilineaceae bacterium]|nr:NAD/NADP octopine/nopaline dehydrogenase family protein [Caldilineaceae bacterium]
MSRSLTILGGGNTAFAVAANLALRGYAVTLCEHPDFAWTLDPIRATGQIKLLGVAEQGAATLTHLTTDPQVACENALLLLIVPAYAHKPFAEFVGPYLRDGHVVVITPGTLGALEFARIVAEQGNRARIIIAETDTAPYVCRKTAPDTATIWGVVSGLGLAAFPAHETEQVAEAVQEIFTVNGRTGTASAISPYPHVLACGLSAMNPVVHPPGVLMNAGRVEQTRGEFYFYDEGVTPTVVQVIYALDGERRAIGRALGLELTAVDAAFHAAGFGPRGDLWATINGSRMLTQLRAPGAINTRWLTEDIPYGIAAWSLLGAQLGVATPLMQALVTLAGAALQQDFWSLARTPERLGLAGLDREEMVRAIL